MLSVGGVLEGARLVLEAFGFCLKKKIPLTSKVCPGISHTEAWLQWGARQ